MLDAQRQFVRFWWWSGRVLLWYVPQQFLAGPSDMLVLALVVLDGGSLDLRMSFCHGLVNIIVQSLEGLRIHVWRMFGVARRLKPLSVTGLASNSAARL